MEDESLLTGGCTCGQLTFQVRGEPTRVGLCHCMTCRKISGSVSNAFAVFPADRVCFPESPAHQARAALLPPQASGLPKIYRC